MEFVGKTSASDALNYSESYQMSERDTRHGKALALPFPDCLDPHIPNSIGQNGLHVAASQGNVELVRRLLNDNVDSSRSLLDINTTDYNGSTALHLAAGNRLDDVVLEVLDHGPNVNIRDRWGQTPLSLYIGDPRADVQVVKKFLNHGADPRNVDSRGRNCLHFAACTGSVELVKLLLDPNTYSSSENIVDIDPVDEEGYTALEFAIYYHHDDVLDELLHHNPDVNIQNRWGNTPLIRSSRSRKDTLHVVRKLLQHGADPRILDSNGENCLHIAAVEGNVELVRVLLDPKVYSSLEKLVDINARTGVRSNGVCNSTALHLAAEQKHDNVLEELLSHHPNVDVRDSAKQTPLSLYIRTPTGDDQVVRKLLQHGANPRDLDTRGRNCLHFAASMGSVELVRVLLDSNVYSSAEKLVDINCTDLQGYTALDFAIYYQHDDVLDEILHHNPDVNIQDGKGNTPVNRSSRRREGTLKVVQKLLQHGADPRILGSDGKNCLHIAAAEGNVKLVSVLLNPNKYSSLEKLVGINSRTGTGSTVVYNSAALHLAAEQKHDAVLDELLDHNPDVDIRDCREQTPLCLYTEGDLIIRKDTLKVVKKFLRHGADPRLLNSSLQNCLHVAASLNSVEIVRLLLDPTAYSSSEKLIDINGEDGNRSTALHLAAARRSDQLLEELLAHNPRVDVLDQQQQTPLSIYTTHSTGSAHVVRRFLENGADPTHVNSCKQNCLHVAASLGNVELVKVFLGSKLHNSSRKLLNINARDGNHSTALHLAAASKHDNVLEELLDQGADVNLEDMCQQTPIILYCNTLVHIRKKPGTAPLKKPGTEPEARSEAAQVVRKFLQHGADPRIVNSCRQNCLHVSSRAGSLEVVRVLLDSEVYSSSSMLVDINAGDGNALTALHLAAVHKNDEVLEELLDHKPNVNLQDGLQQTPLSLYSKHSTGAAHVVSNLLQHGADSNLTNVDRETCLHIAAAEGSIEVVRVLLDPREYGNSNKLVDINARDKDGSTAVHIAIHYKRDDVLDEILIHNPDVNIQDFDGRTPIELCIEYGNGADPMVNRLLHRVTDSSIANKLKEIFQGTWKEQRVKASSNSSPGQLRGEFSLTSRRSLRHDAFSQGFHTKSYDEPFDPTRILLIFAQAQEGDGAVEIRFLHEEGMVLLFGVGLPYSKVVLRADCDVEVREVGEAVWKESWMSRPSRLRFGSLALVDATSASVTTDSLLSGELIQFRETVRHTNPATHKHHHKTHKHRKHHKTKVSLSTTAKQPPDAAQAAEWCGVGVEGETYYYSREPFLSQSPTPRGNRQTSLSWISVLINNLSLKSGGRSGGTDGASSFSPTGTMKDPYDAHGNHKRVTLDKSKSTKKGIRDEFQQVTVRIYLDSSICTFFCQLDQKECSLDTATGNLVYCSTREVLELSNTDICKYNMVPVVTVTFFKECSRPSSCNTFKRFKTILDVSYQIDGNVKDENQFGWYHDQLRVCFECMASGAARRDIENLGVEVLSSVEYRNPERAREIGNSSTSLRGKSGELKLTGGNKHIAGIQLGGSFRRESTSVITISQSNTSPLSVTCLKEANFAIKAVDVGPQLAYEASLYPSISKYDIWDAADRSDASQSGMMSRVSLTVEGKWTVLDDDSHGGVHSSNTVDVLDEDNHGGSHSFNICKYQFTCQRDLNLFQRTEKAPKPRKFFFSSKKKVECFQERHTIQQKMIRVFKINHGFSHMDRLEQPDPHEWTLARLPEAPHPISDIIK